MTLAKIRIKFNANWWIAGIALAALSWTVLSGWSVTCDTPGYLNHAVIRPLVYPLLLDLFRAVFGTGYFTQVMLFQTCMVLLASFYAASVLKNDFSLPDWAFVLLYFMFITPLLPSKSLYASTYGPIGGIILTEALTYAVFVAAFGVMVRSLFRLQAWYFILFAVLSVTATMLRTQMLFMYPVAALLTGFACYKSRKIGFSIGLLTVFMSTLLFGVIAQRAYLSAVYKGKAAVQGSFNVLVLPVLFLSERKDVNLLPDGSDKKILGYIFDNFDEKKLSVNYRFETDDIVQMFYVKKLNPLATAVESAFGRSYGRYVDSYDTQFSQDMNGFSKRVLPILFRRHYLDYFRFCVGMFLYALNFREGVFFSLLLLLFLRRENTRIREIMSVTAVMTLSNRILLALSFGNDRHFFYTNTTEQVVVVVAFLCFVGRANTAKLPENGSC